MTRIADLEAQVARLEGELAEVQTKYDRLLFTHDEVTLPMLYEADERLKVLEPTIAAQDAALRAIQERARQCRTGETAVESDSYHLFEIEREAGAAFSSDAGKEMLDMMERARDAIRDWEKWASGLDTFPPDDLLEWSRRSFEELDALKGVE